MLARVAQFRAAVPLYEKPEKALGGECIEGTEAAGFVSGDLSFVLLDVADFVDTG